MDRVPVLLDTDIGSDIDDAVALAYLLAEPRCELLGITTVTGDTAKRATLAQVLCDAAGRSDIPIHRGTASTLTGPGQPLVPQYEVVSQLPHRVRPNDTVVQFMRETILGRPAEVVLLSIGPMTNISRLFALHPDIPGRLRAWVAMSGFFADPAGKGSWNVTCDPASAAIALATPVPRSIQVGEDVTTLCRLSQDEVNGSFQHPLLQRVLTMARDWFAHRSEIVFHDPLVAALIFDETFCDFTTGRIGIDPLDGRTTFVADPDGRHEVATGVRPDSFFNAFFGAFESARD
jgi:purine nucleosidase